MGHLLLPVLHQLQGDDLKAKTTHLPIPLPPSTIPEAPRAITEEERKFKAYRTLRDARANKRHEGVRKIRKARVRVSLLSLFLALTDILYFMRALLERRRRSKQEEVKIAPTLHLHSSFSSFPLFMFTFVFHVLYQYDVERRNTTVA